MISFHTNPFAPLGGKQTGGMNVYIRELSRSLAHRGHSIDIFIRSADQTSSSIEIETDIRLIKIPLKKIKSGSVNQIDKEISSFSRKVIKFSKDNKRKYAIVHAHYWTSGMAAIELSNEWKIPSILMMHTLGLMKERLQLISKNEANIRIRSERRAIAHSDQLIAATIAEEAELQWLYEVAKEKITVISPGVDLGLFKATAMASARRNINMPLQEKFLLFVGRIDAIKGLETLLSALNIIHKSEAIPNLQLNIIGGHTDKNGKFSNPEINRLIQLAKKLKINSHINFLGSKTQEELPTYYNAADIVILPSHYESFGLVALEAMACARPVLATRVGGLAYLIKHNESGLLSPPGDSESMANNILQLLEDEDLAIQLGANGLLIAQTKSWHSIAGQIESTYHEMIHDPIL